MVGMGSRGGRECVGGMGSGMVGGGPGRMEWWVGRGSCEGECWLRGRWFGRVREWFGWEGSGLGGKGERDAIGWEGGG